MIKLLYFLVLAVFLNIPGFSHDLLYVELLGDTIKIWNNAELNCCSFYDVKVEVNGNNIKMIEMDTSTTWCYCLCNFNLCAALTGLSQGSYTVELFRNSPMSNPFDQLFYISSLEFYYSSSGSICIYQESSMVLLGNSQSECIQNEPGERIIYSNSFESGEDTAGWNGYMEFSNEVPHGGGLQSAYISGGCIVPHTFREMGPFDRDIYLIIRCWGKDLLTGGVVQLNISGDDGDKISLWINNPEWNYYESADTLYCPAGSKIMLSMSSGGIIPGGMLIDLIQIVDIENIVTDLGYDHSYPDPDFYLNQNYPNPFNPSTIISYGIKEKGNVKITILNSIGEEVTILLNELKNPGHHNIEFHSYNLPSGIYFYRLQAGPFTETKKMILLR